MRTFVTRDIRTLLVAIDTRLAKAETLVIIGGAAAALAYKVTRGTRDIDTMNNPRAVMSAYRNAVKDTGIEIPLGAAGVADRPMNTNRGCGD